ncbi:hypothetical protein [Arthrobacter sp. K5]|uniref:Lipoprotein n=1 Tax=Arthrobacter sp. K5 TaxID=2839623 RepID=A0AAU8EUE2_9MICC
MKDLGHPPKPSSGRPHEAKRGNRIFGASLCIVFVLTAAACPGGAGAAAAKYADDVARAAASAESRLRQPQSWLLQGRKATDETSELSRLLANPPEGTAGDSNVRQAIERGRAVEESAAQADKLVPPVQATTARYLEDAETAVAAGATVPSPIEENQVAEAGKTVLKDIVCSLVLDRVAPEERSSLSGEQLTFNQLSDTSEQAVTKEVQHRAAALISQRFSAGFRWGYYGVELVSSADRHLASINQQVTTGNWTLTGEYVFVVKHCLAPPSS